MTLGLAVRRARFSSHRRTHLLALQLATALSGGAVGASAMTSPLPSWTFSPASVGVGNCNDAGPGSLRDTIQSASPGQVIDLTQLGCSTITLTTGALAVAQSGLTLLGPGADSLAIDGAGAQPVLVHSGGGVLSVSGVTIRNGNQNAAAPSGGCIYSAGDLVLESSVVSACKAVTSVCQSAHGGAIFVHGDAFLEGSTVSTSNAGTPAACPIGARAYGGGIYVDGRLRVEDSTISGNTTSSSSHTGYGGGVAARGPSVFVNALIESNYAASGGGVWATAGASFTDSTVSGNSAYTFGGGLWAAGGLPTIVTRSVFAGNSITGVGFGHGGGISSNVPITLTDSQLSRNSALSAAALYSAAYITIVRSTIDYNTNGPAIYNSGAAGVSITNSTIVGNTHLPAPFGSAAVVLRGNATIANSTFAFNSGAFGALFVTGATLDLRSTLLAANHSDDGPSDFNAPPNTTITGDHNLVVAPFPGVVVPSDTITSCPKLDRLAMNGGPTPTVMLLPGSAGIEGGSDIFALTSDQRGVGFVRTFGAGPDVGAFERQGETSDALFSSAFESYCDSHHHS